MKANTFNLDQAIDKWLKSFRKFRSFDDGSIKELEAHLRDYISDLKYEGYSDSEAFEKAKIEFGEIEPLAKEEYSNIESKSFIKNILSTIMLYSYYKSAVRYFVKHRFFSAINIIGLTIGLSIVILISLFIIDELNFDKFNTKHAELYRVVENQYYSGQPVFPVAVTPFALAQGIKDKYPEIVNSTRAMSNSYLFEYQEIKNYEKDGLLVDPSFFDMFSYKVVKGDIAEFDKQLDAIVIEEDLAKKYFGDEDPIGKQITIDKEVNVVIAVIQNVPASSHLDFSYLKNINIVFSKYPEMSENWGSNSIYTYVETIPELNLEQFNAKIKGLIKENNENSVTDIYLQPITDIHLGSVNFVVEVGRKGELIYVQIFGIVAAFILLISCINFMNLSTAQSSKRAKEVAMRKTVGATRTQLIFQFLTESVFLSFIALILALFIVYLILPSFNQLSEKSFSLATLLNQQFGYQFLIMLILGTLITGLLAGSYPAIYLSSGKTINELDTHSTKNKTAGFRRVLVVLQFVISVVMIVSAIAVYNQVQFIQNVDLGYNKENILMTNIPSENADLFKSELSKLGGVINVGSADQHPAYVMSSTSGYGWRGKNPDDNILIHNMKIDENYLETMEMNLVSGRGFTKSDSAVAIINESTQELMGFDNAVGEIIESEGDLKIVGVIRDFNFKSIHNKIEPLIITKLIESNRIFIRYNPQSKSTIASNVEAVYKDVLPGAAFNFYFLDDSYNDIYSDEERTGKLSIYFAVLAILISCMGLFGLASYATEQRRKEISIRKVMGASTPKLFGMLVSDFIKLILISLLISIPTSWYLINQWLENFAYKANLSIWIFITAAIASILIALLTVSFQTLKVSFSSPVSALKE